MLVDWVEAFLPLTKRGNWHWGLDGKVRMNFVALQDDSPWIQSGPMICGVEDISLDCAMMHIFFNYVFKQRGIHSFCHDCYKVVIQLENVEQAGMVEGWQRGECEENGWPCKVGAERRKYVARDWGAYFYCRGVEHGKEMYGIVRKWVDDNLGKDVGVILKRGCTEFEMVLGDSDEWKMIDRQLEVEAEADDVIDYTPVKAQSDVIDDHVYEGWKDWVRQTRKPVTYHETEE